MAQPLKEATPLVADTGAQVSAAPEVPVPLVMARETVVVAEVTTLPAASSTATTGWVPKALPPVVPVGWVVKTSLEAAPAVTAKVELWMAKVPAVVPSVASVARVYDEVDAWSTVQSVKVATPLTAASL